MESQKEPEDILEKSYLDLKKLSNEIENNYNEIMSKDYKLSKWEEEGKKIEENVKTFQELLKIVIKNFEDAKKDNRIKKETLSAIDEGLNKIRKEVEPKVEEMLDKISKINIAKKTQYIVWNVINFILIIVAYFVLNKFFFK